MIGFDDLTAVVLAGGRGTRLQSLYPETAKPMIPICGKPFIHWITEWIADHGLNHFVYSTGYRAEQIENWVMDDSLPDLVRVCQREQVPLGTGGGLLNCLELCRDWILTVNGDSLVLGGLAELLALRRGRDFEGGLIGIVAHDTTRYGSLVVNDDKMLIDFCEKVHGHGLINGGVYLFHKRLLRDFLPPEGACSLEYDLVPDLIKRGAHLRVVIADNAPFIDIGTPKSLADAEGFILRHLAGR